MGGCCSSRHKTIQASWPPTQADRKHLLEHEMRCMSVCALWEMINVNDECMHLWMCASNLVFSRLHSQYSMNNEYQLGANARNCSQCLGRLYLYYMTEASLFSTRDKVYTRRKRALSYTTNYTHTLDASTHKLFQWVWGSEKALEKDVDLVKQEAVWVRLTHCIWW